MGRVLNFGYDGLKNETEGRMVRIFLLFIAGTCIQPDKVGLSGPEQAQDLQASDDKQRWFGMPFCSPAFDF